ncbi:MAG: acyl-CoA mutase large subunit family protein [Candidatus Cloacimonetes bacterium]|nr:acyl-CoA mutase large subunit family protein [Candidatus Cloacimonadota bacterium]
MTDNKLPPLDLPGAFPDATPEQWRKAAEALLKGTPYDKIMRTATPEGITWDGIFTSDDARNLPYTAALPGQFPYVRGTRPQGYHQQPWSMAQPPAVGAPAHWNKALLSALGRGLNAVALNIDAAGRAGQDADEAPADSVGADGLSASSLADIKAALRDVDLAAVPVRIDAGLGGMFYLPMLLEAAGGALHGAGGIDPLGELAGSGKLPLPLDDIYDILAAMITYCGKHTAGMRPLSASGIVWHEAGASGVQELACALAAGVAYLRALIERGVSANDAAAGIEFSFGLGPVFFAEIAKLRAARMLWANVVRAFGGDDEAAKMRIHVRTSSFHATTLDPYVNSLRATTEAFSGVVGAADSIGIDTFDAPLRQGVEHSRRMARNIHLILSEEAHIDHVLDPAGGSYFVEWLTDEVARKAWEMLQGIEADGGLAEALAGGGPQREVAAVLAERCKKVAARRDVKVGLNMYVNHHEPELPAEATDVGAERAEAVRLGRSNQPFGLRMNDLVASMMTACRGGCTVGQLRELLFAGAKAWPQVTPVPPLRLSEPWERLRLAVQTSGRNRRVFLAGMGPLRQHKARLDWSQGFFEPGGYEVVAQSGLATPEAAAKAAAEAGAAVAVLCSTDDTFPELVPAFVSAMKHKQPKVVAVLAGYPKDMVETYRQAGIDEFIHVRANAWEVLAAIARQTGVTV